MDFIELLHRVVQAGASDLHLKAGNYPIMRVHGSLRPDRDSPKLDPETLRAASNTDEFKLRIQGVTDIEDGEVARTGRSEQANQPLITQFEQ